MATSERRSEASTSGVGLESTKRTTRVQNAGCEQLRTLRHKEQTAAREYGNRVGEFKFGSSLDGQEPRLSVAGLRGLPYTSQ